MSEGLQYSRALVGLLALDILGQCRGVQCGMWETQYAAQTVCSWASILLGKVVAGQLVLLSHEDSSHQQQACSAS